MKDNVFVRKKIINQNLSDIIEKQKMQEDMFRLVRTTCGHRETIELEKGISRSIDQVFNYKY